MVRLSTFIDRYVVADVSKSIKVYRLDMPINGVACPGSATRAVTIVGIWIAYHNRVVLVYPNTYNVSLSSPLDGLMLALSLQGMSTIIPKIEHARDKSPTPIS